MSDRNLGYCVVLFLTVFIAGSSVYLLTHVFAPAYCRTIVFNFPNSLNFVKKQDPVRFRGTEAGKVRNTYLKNGKTYVTIETNEPLDIHPGYLIIADAKGFMGDRYIEINPGDTAQPRIDDDKPLSGIFPLGPVEGIAYVAELGEKIHSLNRLILELDKSRVPLEHRLSHLIKKTDSITESLAGILNITKASVFSGTGALTGTLCAADQKARKLGESAPKTISSLEEIAGKTRRLFNVADTFTSSCEQLFSRLEAAESKLPGDDITRLTNRIRSLRK
jgi:phospholipid/cholesterol/gamma-HCH transport system substrate-binding protein